MRTFDAALGVKRFFSTRKESVSPVSYDERLISAARALEIPRYQL